jgi:hypothetical protein
MRNSDCNIHKRWSQEDAQKLAKIAGMFGSSHPGERAAAALKADQLVRACGETWTSIIADRQLPPPHDWRRRTPDDWRTMVNACLFRIETLSPKEKSFIQSLARWRGEPSPKQMTWLKESSRACRRPHERL